MLIIRICFIKLLELKIRLFSIYIKENGKILALGTRFLKSDGKVKSKGPCMRIIGGLWSRIFLIRSTTNIAILCPTNIELTIH